MNVYRATFIYKEESYDEIYDGEDERDVEFAIENDFESNAFYDNHYVTDLEITEMN